MAGRRIEIEISKLAAGNHGSITFRYSIILIVCEANQTLSQQ